MKYDVTVTIEAKSVADAVSEIIFDADGEINDRFTEIRAKAAPVGGSGGILTSYASGGVVR